jgi:hypothetical protein
LSVKSYDLDLMKEEMSLTEEIKNSKKLSRKSKKVMTDSVVSLL